MALFRKCVCVLDSQLLKNQTLGRQFRSFRSSAKKDSRWPQKRIKENKFAEVPFEGIKVENNATTLQGLTKPLIFTIAFSSASIGGCAIWQYENMRKRAISVLQRPFNWAQDKIKQKKAVGVRQELNKWWAGLSDGEKLFIPICFLNGVVFLAWRIPRFQPAMVKYFASNPFSSVVCWPMVLSTFSHYSLFHIGANMYVLHSFSSGAVSALGKEQFLAMYLSAGVISSFTSCLYKVVTKRPGMSIGASGAIMGVLGYVCTQFPDTQLSIIFLPMYTFTASNAITCVLGLDLAGVLLGWKFFDHAAHLGGALFGIMWAYWGNSNIWQKRGPFLQWWHEIRTKNE